MTFAVPRVHSEFIDISDFSPNTLFITCYVLDGSLNHSSTLSICQEHWQANLQKSSFSMQYWKIWKMLEVFHRALTCVRWVNWCWLLCTWCMVVTCNDTPSSGVTAWGGTVPPLSCPSKNWPYRPDKRGVVTKRKKGRKGGKGREKEGGKGREKGGRKERRKCGKKRRKKRRGKESFTEKLPSQ